MRDRNILDSWKQISDHLHRSIKTCQRWESELGMPVYRLEDSPRPGVFAYSDELDRWLLEKLNRSPRSASAALRKRRKIRSLVMIPTAILAILAIMSIVFHLIRSGPAAPDARRPAVAVLAFENRTRDAGLNPWRTALPDLIAAGLEQSGSAAVISRGRILPLLRRLDPEGTGSYSMADLAGIGDACAVDCIIVGDLSQSAAGISIRFRLVDLRSGKTVHAEPVTCPGRPELIHSKDELIRRIQQALTRLRN